MKNFKLITILALFAINSQTINAQSTEKKISAIYKGITVSDNFRFEDRNGNPIVFHDENQVLLSQLSLNDEDLINKRLIVTYKWVDIALLNNKGLPTRKTMKVKRIYNYYLK